MVLDDPEHTQSRFNKAPIEM
ncbi:hypothetical protein WH5701_08709 [Synechococcus sp. WH 5701]|nr:hypothetical protein WH5701_08709 [Synechococcus sp. WH 5701]